MVPDRASSRAAPRRLTPLLLLILLLCGIASGPSAQSGNGAPPAATPPTAAPPAATPALANEPPPTPPPDVTAIDSPNDGGQKIDLSWKSSSDETNPAVTIVGYDIERATSPDGPFKKIGRVPVGNTMYTDSRSDSNRVEDGTGYYYRVSAAGMGSGPWTPSAVVGPAVSSGQWFDTRKTAVLFLTVIFCLTVVILIREARRGRTFYVRPIPGLSAVDEAIGRATEMGRPILFVCGLGTAADVATLAAFTLLGRVAKKTAEYQTQVLVPCYDPIVMTIAQEIVKSSYMDAGRPELYRQDDIFFVTQDQFPYAAAVNGIMLREHPATNFYIGKFYAESLVMAETGNLAGSIQIAGTDEVTQIPFFVAACDYTLIGEELYASSAYLSQEPPLLGTLKAQDYGKAIGAIILIVGTILAILGQRWFVDFFRVE